MMSLNVIKKICKDFIKKIGKILPELKVMKFLSILTAIINNYVKGTYNLTIHN